MKPEIEKRVIEHGKALISFFELPEITDPIQLCRKLRRIEAEGHKLAEQYCNGDIEESEEEMRLAKLALRLVKILPCEKIFFNTDPRGYFLKIREKYSKEFYYKDWGGYGIIAPDLT